MSGFAGIIRLEPGLETAEADRATIARMAEAIAFRGPDAQQQWNQNGASFAFSLLSTGPAPHAATQPVTLDGDTWLLGDVRCDGRDDLIAQLEQHGVSVARTASSEELVLHWFARFGVTALPDLEGDFSFVLWQQRERRLFAFRDLSGARPFFYSHRAGILCFSNTLRAILLTPVVARCEYSQQFIADFLLGSPHYDPQLTIYRDILRLPAGSLLEFSSNDLRVRRIANLPIENLLPSGRDEDVIEEFRRLFRRAVADRLPKTNTAILLSGGLDSTSVAVSAIAEREVISPGAPLNLRAFTLDFRPLFEDEEGPLAKGFADAVSLPFELLHTAQILPCDGVDRSPPLLFEPLPWPYWDLQPFYISHIHKNSQVMLTGDAGDEMLRAQGAPYLRYLSSRHGVAAATASFIRFLISRQKLPALGAGFQAAMWRVMGQVSPEIIFPSWFVKKFEIKFRLRQRFIAMNEKPTSLHPFNPWSYAKLNGYLAHVMEGQDATCTGYPVECRAPFLDRRLIRFVLRLPPIPWAMEKDLLRRAQEGSLSEDIRLRPKVPLQHDPLLLHMAAGKWSPQAPEACAEALNEVVEWKGLQQSLLNSSGTTIYVHLRAILLSRWLKSVENHVRIQ